MAQVNITTKELNKTAHAVLFTFEESLVTSNTTILHIQTTICLWTILQKTYW